MAVITYPQFSGVSLNLTKTISRDFTKRYAVTANSKIRDDFRFRSQLREIDQLDPGAFNIRLNLSVLQNLQLARTRFIVSCGSS
jgi:hypothetical protein